MTFVAFLYIICYNIFMIMSEQRPRTYVRTIDADTVDKINGALDDLASTKDYFRPVPVESPLGLYVMSQRSYLEVAESIDLGIDHSELNDLLDADGSDSVANKPIAAIPFGVRFPTPAGRKDAAIKDAATAAGYNSLRGIRKAMLQLQPIAEKLYCPPEFKNATRPLGAIEFYDDPVSVTVGWTDLQTRREVMNERREEIIEAVSSVAPFVLMSAITLEEV